MGGVALREDAGTKEPVPPTVVSFCCTTSPSTGHTALVFESLAVNQKGKPRDRSCLLRRLAGRFYSDTVNRSVFQVPKKTSVRQQLRAPKGWSRGREGVVSLCLLPRQEGKGRSKQRLHEKEGPVHGREWRRHDQPDRMRLRCRGGETGHLVGESSLPSLRSRSVNRR